MSTVIGYKLFRKRKDGTLGPLFINARLRVPVGEWLEAEDHPTKGYAHRPGWHAAPTKYAPHLSEEGRVWCKVLLDGVREYARPKSQGGTWLLATRLKVLEIIHEDTTGESI
jgi:hypothetical protein